MTSLISPIWRSERVQIPPYSKTQLQRQQKQEKKKYGASKVASKYQQMICLSTQKHDASVQIESKYLANGHEILELLELSTILQRS